MSSRLAPQQRSYVVAAMLAVLTLVGLAVVVIERPTPSAAGGLVPASETIATTSTTHAATPGAGEPADPEVPATLPHGASRIFGDDRFLVAYYGTADTGSLGVLGEDRPARMVQRLEQAAAPFARRKSQVQIVFELIVTVADASPGKDGDYNHDIAKAQVQRYIDAAHEHDALLLLDIQPGRAHFRDVARRWGWALKDPYVGLALDPKWRMGRHGVPGQRIGSVSAAEINRTSGWLRDLVRRNALPQKLFVLHQFRTDMVDDIRRVEPRTGLVMVQHVDGFGTPGQKLGTFRAVARPQQFRMGFKLFYDEDVRRMSAADVRRLRPHVRFVSFQ